ncbi:uncharacterized protein LOC8267184 [Ricinus communis]|uniref:Allyl alcohol dehydrogenase n=1 Tax=Ricinus communis TaxID=3988 RepID=B9SRZ8_RICCO|nr:uncharacterized protein LOC8267184 [Ricinus communis]EEF33589.1 conserved hypothetical protein [Ricinus communis]|eukprot:XP_002528767.1 uncharacterized protein LOC8267184 [Ricinus communis]
MGLLSWFKGSAKSESKPSNSSKSETFTTSEVPGMNGAVEVLRPPKNVTVFEFGSIAASNDNVTLAGYCPVSNDLEPCRWEILPASDADAPQFRVVF